MKIVLNGQRIKEVDRFKYLGSTIMNNGRCLKEISTRAGMAMTAFRERKKLLISKFEFEEKADKEASLVCCFICFRNSRYEKILTASIVLNKTIPLAATSVTRALEVIF